MSAEAPLSQRPSQASRLGFENMTFNYMTINYLLSSLTSQLNQRIYNDAKVEYNRRLLQWIADSNELKCLTAEQRFKLFVTCVLNMLIGYLSSLDHDHEHVESKIWELCNFVFDDQEEPMAGYKKEINDLRCLVYQHVACLVDINFFNLFNESSVHKQSIIEFVEKHRNLRANSSSCRRPEVLEITYKQLFKFKESREQLCQEMEEYVKTYVKSPSVLYQLSNQNDELKDQDKMIMDSLPTRQRNDSEKQLQTPNSSRGVAKASNEDLSDTESDMSYAESYSTESEETSRATSSKIVGGQATKRKRIKLTWTDAETNCLREGVEKCRKRNGKIDWDGILNEYKEVFVNRDKRALYDGWRRNLLEKEKPPVNKE